MDWRQGLLLGAVQGLTEFLPVSSSGHLLLVSRIFGIAAHSLALDVFLHAGTLAAVMFAYRRTLWRLVRRPRDRLARFLLIGTAPAVLAGVVLEEEFARVFHSGATLGIEFVLTGLLLLWAEAKRLDDPSDASHPAMAVAGQRLTGRRALWIGCAQGAAIMPALSRSGLTMAAALALGVSREEAVDFSFLLSVPAIAGATLWEARKLPLSGISPSLWIGMLASAVTGYVAIRFVTHWVRRGKLNVFGYYTVAVGLLVMLDQVVTHTVF